MAVALRECVEALVGTFAIRSCVHCPINDQAKVRWPQQTDKEHSLDCEMKARDTIDV
jgi:hypothetical protein